MHEHFLPLMSVKEEVTLPLMALDPLFYESDATILTEWFEYLNTAKWPDSKDKADYPTITIRALGASEVSTVEWAAGPPEAWGQKIYFECEGDDVRIAKLSTEERRAVQAFALRLERLLAERAKRCLVRIDNMPAEAAWAAVEGLREDARHRVIREIAAHAQRVGGLSAKARKSHLG